MKRKTFVKADDSFKVNPLLPRRDNQGNNNRGTKRGRDNDAGNGEKYNKRKATEVCFACRKPGHSVNRCPKNKEHANICYNCGTTEHRLKDCRKPRKNNELPYAKCFICNQEGHLAGQCPKNEKGLYPNGGSCAICKQVDHLAKDCPVTKETAGTTAVGMISLDQGADDDDYHIFAETKQKLKETKKKPVQAPVMQAKKKVVKF
ncbi:hypothetical protein CU098_012638 [Rhizopus stolonifer]|uniref:CCHC-type domain-containing protein n=1 Tax=Rhizopus stolonifer TaxID=4846 RepID=A0A367KS20_RHIST|nr:hypothetical protein CU098_012638 [Rhizopus stolonifer]